MLRPARRQIPDLEDTRRRQRRERERTHVEENAVDLGTTRAPLDRHACERERERGARSEQRRAREAAHGTHRDRAGVVDLERKCLADADERDDREKPEEILGRPRQDQPRDARADPGRADHRNHHPEPDREGEENRPVHRVWARVRATPALLRHLELLRRREGGVMVSVLGDRDEPRLALGRHQQRLRARAEDAVPALELGAVDREVGLVDQLVRIRSVLREAGDADRDRGADRLARRLDVERAVGDRATNPLGDLERLLGRRLGQEDRELLTAEPRRHVVVAQLRSEHLRDSLEHGVAGEVAVGVVDVAEQVEVGHDQRQRTLEPLRATELLGEGRGEVTGVEEAGFRIDTRLRLQLRNAERAVDENQRRDRERNQPLVRLPEGVRRDAERGEHEVRRQVLDVEEPRLAKGESACEPEHDREVRVVDRDEDEAADDSRDAEPERVARKDV